MVNIALSHTREKITAVVDISEGGALVALTSNNPGVPSRILASGRSSMSFESRTKEQTEGMIGRQIQEAASMVLKQYEAEGHHLPIPSVYAIVHAPWARTVAIRTSFNSPDEIKIQDSLIESLAKDAFAAASAIDRSRLLEASAILIQLNGYATREPSGKYARNVEVTSLVSDADAGVKSAATAALQAVFPVATISWRSSARSLIALLRAQDVEHRLIVNMSADTTHIISMRDGILEERIVPEGVRTILARIAGGRTSDEVLGHVRMLARDVCSNEACEEVEKSLATVEPELVRIFGEAIGQLAASRHVANDLVLVTHVDLEPWLTRFFSRIDFSQFTVTTLPFNVQGPSAALSEFVASDTADTSLLVGAALVNMETNG